MCLRAAEAAEARVIAHRFEKQADDLGFRRSSA
jgi:hypothetical protein